MLGGKGGGGCKDGVWMVRRVKAECACRLGGGDKTVRVRIMSRVKGGRGGLTSNPTCHSKLLIITKTLS